MAHDSSPLTTKPSGLPQPWLEWWLSPIREFLHVQSAGGIVLLVCTALALILANSQAAEWFESLWHTPVELSIGNFRLAGDVGHLVINDGLMVIFFFVVGLEIKRELVSGELNEFRKAMLPVFAALGGMIVPALIYAALQWGQPAIRGWAVPMATDIAFVVGVLALFGSRIPFPLKILLLSLAIVDDLGAVLIIAFVFTEQLAWNWLALAGMGLALVVMLNRLGVRGVGVYVVVGIFIWVTVLKSGVHPTVAGVLLGLLTPTSAWVPEKSLFDVLGELWDRLRGTRACSKERRANLDLVRITACEAVSPLERLIEVLHPWVAFVIMPLFALANAGVKLELQSLREPVAFSVAAGLVVGKPIGVLLFCWLSIKLGLTRMPTGVTWPLLAGAGCLAGIGFTMALFLKSLAFPIVQFPHLDAAGRIGILAGSFVSAVLGVAILLYAIRRAK
jgi:Na+:H+ antiporter, NhaA family